MWVVDNSVFLRLKCHKYNATNNTLTYQPSYSKPRSIINVHAGILSLSINDGSNLKCSNILIRELVPA